MIKYIQLLTFLQHELLASIAYALFIDIENVLLAIAILKIEIASKIDL